MNRLSKLILLAAACLPTLAAAQEPDSVIGTWRNPKGSVEVRTMRCGRALCGVVTYASPKVTGDAKAKGIDPLVGTNLLQDYRPSGRGEWTGRVLLPKEGRTFSSKLIQQDANHLSISGCILGGLFCKNQIWTRR